jgi:carboxymethylenebutenolidase
VEKMPLSSTLSLRIAPGKESGSWPRDDAPTIQPSRPTAESQLEERSMEIVKHEVIVTTGNEKMPCHLARPASGGPYPSLIVVMEAFGLNNNIKNITERFAAEGFVALSPNLFFRNPDNVAPYSDLPKALRLMGSLNDDQVVADMTAAINHLKTMKEVKPKFGTVGFCMGGRISFLTACRNNDVKATAPYYGGGMVSAPKPGAKAPIDHAENLQASVLAFFGGKDAFIPLSDVDKFRDALKKSGKQADVVLYPDADHGFMCEERPSFHPTHSKEAWAKTIAFFKQHLV